MVHAIAARPCEEDAVRTGKSAGTWLAYGRVVKENAMKRAFRLALTLAGATAALSAWPADQSSKKEKETEQTQGVGIPTTPEEHLALAAEYDKKAATLREDATMHRKMFATHEKSQGSPSLQSKTGRELPWITKMRNHCDAYIQAADKLAAEAERFAEFHRMRAAEMKGQ